MLLELLVVLSVGRRCVVWEPSVTHQRQQGTFMVLSLLFHLAPVFFFGLTDPLKKGSEQGKLFKCLHVVVKSQQFASTVWLNMTEPRFANDLHVSRGSVNMTHAWWRPTTWIDVCLKKRSFNLLVLVFQSFFFYTCRFIDDETLTSNGFDVSLKTGEWK